MPGRTGPDVLGRAVRWCVGALVATGAAQVGGFPDPPPPPATSAGPRPCVTGRERWVQREAARGIAELERMLDRQRQR